MATTTNYSWETPDDTDLVKDGAAAIRTLGSSIDTTTKALNPSTTLGDIEYRSSTANTNTRLPIGTTGQVLAVVGGVPAWATTADQTPLTTKGDIFTFTTVDARLGVGANGTVLTADSAEATGLKWVAPASGTTFVGASVYNSTTQSIANNTYTILTFNSEAFDSDAFHSTSTNTSRLTIPAGKSGKYQVTAALGWENVGTYNYGSVLFKNGSAYQYINFTAGTTAGSLNSWSFVIDLVATDYLEWQVYQGSGSANNAKGNNAPSERTTFSINYLGA